MFDSLKDTVAEALVRGGLAMSGGLPTVEPGDSRSDVTFPNVSGRFEVKPGSRKTINKKGKYIASTLGIGRALTASLPRYIVPISPIPITEDTEWNKKSMENWHIWSESKMMCDSRQTITHRKQQRQAVQSMLRAGETFWHYTRPRGVSGGYPKIQMFDDTQVGGMPTSIPMARMEKFYDGIEYNDNEIPLGYSVIGKNGAPPQYVRRQVMSHMFDPERIGQGRGITWLYAGANSAVDMLDIAALEKGSEKLHAALAVAVKQRTGDDGGKGLSNRMAELAKATFEANGSSDSSSDSSAKGSKKTDKLMMDEIAGVLVKYLNPDEEIELLSSKRTSAVWLGYMDFIARDVASSFGVPVEFVWALVGLNGSNTRTILQQSQFFFDEVQDLVVDMVIREAYIRVTASAMKLYEQTGGQRGLEPCKDPRWWRAEYHGPAKITIDNKNDAKSDVERLNNGMLTIPDYWRERDKDPNKQASMQIDWLADKAAECEEKGVPFDRFMRLQPGQPGAEDMNKRIEEIEDKKEDE